MLQKRQNHRIPYCIKYKNGPIQTGAYFWTILTRKTTIWTILTRKNTNMNNFNSQNTNIYNEIWFLLILGLIIQFKEQLIFANTRNEQKRLPKHPYLHKNSI